MDHPARPRRLRPHSLTLAMACGFAPFAVLLLAPAQACAAESVQRYAIAAGSLKDALNQFGHQANLMLAYPAAQTSGLSTPGLQGTYSVEQGLAALLQGSGLQAVRLSNGSYTLQPAPEGKLTLPVSTINGRSEQNALDPLPQSYVATHSSIGTKTDTPINEVPQAISVITRGEMDQRGVQDFNSALAYTPGIRAIDYIGGQGAPDIYMRGFRSFNLFGIYQDGLRSGFNQYDTDFDTFALDRIDVIKGPASVLYGQMAPGGMVNLTSKRPQDTPIHHIEVQGGMYDRQQVGLDLGGRLTENGSLLGRVVVMNRESGTQVDHSPDDRTYIAPSLTWKPDDANTLTVLASYNKTKKGGSEQSVPIEGTVVANPLGHINSKVFYGDPKLAHYIVEDTSIGYAFEHLFNDDWKYQQNARYMHANVDFTSEGADGYTTLPNSQLDDDHRTYTYSVQRRPKNTDTYLFDNNVQGKFATGPVQHTVIAGVDYAYYRSHETRRNGSDSTIDVFDPVYTGHDVVYDDFLQRDTSTKLNQLGVYLQDQLALDNWRLTLGGRNDWLDDKEVGTYNYTGTPLLSDTRQKDHKFTGRAGVAYLFDNGLTPYASYSTSFQPNTDTDDAGNFLAPTTGKQYEVGVKYQPPGVESFVTVSAFDLTQQNVTDQNINGEVSQTGEVRSRGIEVEAKASLTGNLNLAGSYAYNNAEISEDYRYKGNTPRSVPRNTASLWLDYTIASGPLEGLGMGAGQRYVGSSYNIQNTVKTPQYMLTDASLRYDLSPLGLAGTKVSLTATNLFDKHYFTPGFYENTVFYGNRRNVIATLSYDW